MAIGEDITKRCNTCLDEKPLSEFYLRSNGRRAQCKACVHKKHSDYVSRNREAVSAYKKQWQEENVAEQKKLKQGRYQRNAEDIKRRVAEYAKAHPERVKSYKKKWKQDNLHRGREYAFLRGRRQRRSTPSWANRAAMAAIYREARELTKTAGVEHHVDHIVPLQSPFVCGLHCETNMQILEASANISKLNRWWPDMWA